MQHRLQGALGPWRLLMPPELATQDPVSPVRHSIQQEAQPRGINSPPPTAPRRGDSWPFTDTGTESQRH